MFVYWLFVCECTWLTIQITNLLHTSQFRVAVVVACVEDVLDNIA